MRFRALLDKHLAVRLVWNVLAWLGCARAAAFTRSVDLHEAPLKRPCLGVGAWRRPLGPSVYLRLRSELSFSWISLSESSSKEACGRGAHNLDWGDHSKIALHDVWLLLHSAYPLLTLFRHSVYTLCTLCYPGPSPLVFAGRGLQPHLSLPSAAISGGKRSLHTTLHSSFTQVSL